MTEAEWFSAVEAHQPLLHVRHAASIRQLRLVASAYARWLQSLPEYENARPFADLIERVADEPQSWEDLEQEIWALPGGDWRLSHTIGGEDKEQLGRNVNKLVWLASCQIKRPDCPETMVHRKMLLLLQEVFGNPFRPIAIASAWHNSTVTSLAEAIYTDRDFDRLPILADALEEAGCTSRDVLEHCRQPGEHVRGCWVVDLVLGKA